MLSTEYQLVMMGYKGEVTYKDTKERGLLKRNCVVKGTIECLEGGEELEYQVMMGYMRAVMCEDPQERGLLKMKCVVEETMEYLVGETLHMSR